MDISIIYIYIQIKKDMQQQRQQPPHAPWSISTTTATKGS